MELIKLSEKVRKKEIEEGEDWLKKLEEEANRYEITDYCDETAADDNKIEDSEVKELLESTQKAEKTRRISVERLKTAFNLTDMKKTIENGGAHEDGTPKLALTKMGNEEAVCTIQDGGLRVGRIRNIIWPYVCSGRGLISKRKDKIISIISALVLSIGIAMLVLSLTVFGVKGKYFLVPNNAGLDFATIAFTVIFIIGGIICTSCYLLEYFRNSHENSFTCNTPTIPKTILERLKGEGPFYTLFETKKGWERAETDPVIFRRITVNGKDYWEPQRGWNMTPREKESMVPLE